MCERCDGLCCRVYDIFDQTTWRLVKRAWDKCGYLDVNNRCRIHTTRDKHPGYSDSCSIYDCLEWWPIVTSFARRIPEDIPQKFAIISSLLEVIRLKLTTLSEENRKIVLLFAARELNSLDTSNQETLLLSVKVVRTKIEHYKIDD